MKRDKFESFLKNQIKILELKYEQIKLETKWVVIYSSRYSKKDRSEENVQKKDERYQRKSKRNTKDIRSNIEVFYI